MLISIYQDKNKQITISVDGGESDTAELVVLAYKTVVKELYKEEDTNANNG